jgi:hypothetical protein
MEETNVQDDTKSGEGGSDSREQRPGEGATTRFGMEEGDNSDIPATGGPTPDGKPEESGSGG